MKVEGHVMKVEDIARVCHEALRAYGFSIGDHTLPTWDMASTQESTISGVRAVITAPQITPEQLHEKWTQERQAAGWKWGPVKLPERLEHPCLVPYDQLPSEQRMKDVLFRAVVLACMPGMLVDPKTGGEPVSKELKVEPKAEPKAEAKEEVVVGAPVHLVEKSSEKKHRR